MKLHSAKELLEDVLRTAKATEVPSVTNGEREMTVDEILRYAKKLANFTSAPPNFDPAANDPLVEVEPPYPSELALRASLMNQPNMGRTMSSTIVKSSTPSAGQERASEAPRSVAPSKPPPVSSAFDRSEGEDEDSAHPLFDLDLNPDLE